MNNKNKMRHCIALLTGLFFVVVLFVSGCENKQAEPEFKLVLCDDNWEEVTDPPTYLYHTYDGQAPPFYNAILYKHNEEIERFDSRNIEGYDNSQYIKLRIWNSTYPNMKLPTETGFYQLGYDIYESPPYSTIPLANDCNSFSFVLGIEKYPKEIVFYNDEGARIEEDTITFAYDGTEKMVLVKAEDPSGVLCTFSANQPGYNESRPAKGYFLNMLCNNYSYHYLRPIERGTYDCKFSLEYSSSISSVVGTGYSRSIKIIIE